MTYNVEKGLHTVRGFVGTTILNLLNGKTQTYDEKYPVIAQSKTVRGLKCRLSRGGYYGVVYGENRIEMFSIKRRRSA
ncbi:MAG: hypothetical protein PHE67_00575 [Campylobacterales bacterium]|nr:hypothetical protein [Campylobacterales bacterium]